MDLQTLTALTALTAIAMYDAAPGPTLSPVGFAAEATGRVQLARTGSGFWRHDHGAPFVIDKKLLATLVKNTQIRARPLRGDFMHWSNQDREDPADYRPAGYIDPRSLTIAPWSSPEGSREWGIFAPAVWTPETKALIDAGMNQISPVIDWVHRLRWNTAEYPAGTLIGPTITKWALVDEGFFWMDPARYYSNNASSEGLIYREVSMLTLEELLTMIASLQKAGTPEEKIIALVKATLTGDSSVTADPLANPGADATGAAAMTANAPEGQGAAPITMAARLYNLLNAQRQPVATPAPVARQVAGQSPLLSSLLAAIQTPARASSNPAPRVAPPAGAPSTPASFSLADIQGAVTGAISTALAPITQRIEGLEIAQSVELFRQADAAGLHAGLDQETAIRMFTEAPGAYQSHISKRQALVGGGLPAATPGASPLTRTFNNAGAQVDDRQELANMALAYQNDPKNVKAGRKPTYDEALSYAIGVASSKKRGSANQY